MPEAYLDLHAERHVTPLRDRAVAIGVAVAIEILIVLALLTIGGQIRLPKKENDLSTFSVYPSPDHEAASKPSPRVVKQKPKPAGGSSPAPPAPKSAAPVPPPPVTLPGVIPLNLADNDLSKVPTHAGNNTPGQGDAGVGKDSASAYGPGEGPGGEKLYDAEWYREPTDAELNGYLHGPVPPGSVALIACKTVERYHVDNCRTLGDSPPGLGLARAMREAAWQFLVRPPRIGGKPIIGAWVRIRIDFNEKKRGDRSSDDGPHLPDGN